MTVHKGKIHGDLVLVKGDDASKVTEIGGYLRTEARGKINVPLLASINGEKVASNEQAHQRLVEVAKHALADPANFIMDGWHNESNRCGTAHCIAGWAIHLEGAAGYDPEAKVGPESAGAVLLGAKAAEMFFLPKDEATSALRKILANAGESI